MSASDNDNTYEVLPGAHDNAGGRYEYLMTSYVALKLLQSTESNFKLSNNSKPFGKFDDIILENGSRESWAVQLKHSANEKELTPGDLGAVQNKFSLKMYFEGYHRHLAKPVLFTNKKFTAGVEVHVEKKPYVLTSFKSHDACPFNTVDDDGIFQFDIKVKPRSRYQGDADELKSWQTFLKHFRLCANQKSASELDVEVSRLWDLGFGGGGDAASYKKFFEEYWEKKPAVDGKKQKLDREQIEREVARIVLGPYARPTIASKVNSAKEDVLKTIILQFDVAVVDADCGTQIANLWQPGDCDAPSIVSEANAELIYRVLNILKTGKHKFVLVGSQCLDLGKLTNWKVLENLSNLKSDDYKTITDMFSCVVQGRKKTCLSEILRDNSKLNSFIKIGHLIKMTNKPFVIGDETVKLPAPYINRSVQKHVFSCDLIGNLTCEDALVISCVDVNKLLAMVNEHKHHTTKVINITNRDCEHDAELSPMIFVTNHKLSLREFVEICSQNEIKSVLNFEYVDNSLDLLSSHGKLSRFVRFHQKNTDKIVKDSEILTHFMNKTIVLLAHPGMGKTVCGDFIKRTCPFDAWPVKIDLREKLSWFTACSGVQNLLARILDIDHSDSIKRGFQEFYNNDRRLMLIWDGLDEVGIENIDSVIGKIDEISRATRHHQCVTSRYNLRDKLESSFNVLAIAMNEVTSIDQTKYIEERLRQVYPETIREVTDEIHKSIVKNNLKDMLGIPLLLNMFTTVCAQSYERIRKDLGLVQIYRIFIDGKFDGHFGEKVASNQNTLLRQICDGFKASRVSIDYPKAALITCFGRDFLRKFNLNCDDFLKEISDTGDVIGLITTITEENTPIFLHKTFAEYFAALYLTKQFEQFDSKILNELLFRPEHRNVRFLFDLCLSENHPAHQAVLAMNFDKLKEIAEENRDVILDQDKGGRNVLHLACSYGTSRVPLKLLNFTYLKSHTFNDEYKNIPSGVKTFDATPLHSLDKENKDYENIVEYLISVADQKTINDTDKIYGLNCVGYADASLSLHAIESLLSKKSCEHFKQHLRNYTDTETLLAYSVVLNYENLSSLFDRIPYFELFRDNHFDSIFCDVGFEHLSHYNMLILIIEFGNTDLLRKALKNIETVRLMKYRTYNVAKWTPTISEIDSLIWAVKKGKIDVFNLLLQRKLYLNRQYETGGDNILHIAVKLRQINMVKQIVDEKLIEIDTRNRFEETPLQLAIAFGNLDIAVYLIAQGAKVDVTNFRQENLLHIACKKGHLKIVQYLTQQFKFLQEQLDVNQNTPLLTAAKTFRFDIAVYLQANGANFKATDKDARNILHYACLKGDLLFVKSLTKENLIEFDTQNCNGFTPLLLAASENRFEIVKYLWENGADFKTADKDGRNLLHYACLRGDLPFIKSLTKNNLIDLDTQDCNGYTPLLQEAFQNRFDVVKYLLENGACLKTKNNKGQNILHYTCFKGNLPFIKRLTKANLIDLDTQDCNGFNPLLLAASENRFGIVKYLLKNGASFKATDINAQNVLHYACLKGDLPLIKRLPKENLIDLDTQDCNGFNPLLLAASENRFDIVKYLWENGADFKTADKKGQNLLQYACDQGNLSFIKSLTTKNLIELDIQHGRPLFVAAGKNRFDIVKYLLENGASFKATDSSLQNVLHFACFKGDLPFIKSLKKENLIELETRHFDGCTPLLLAASKNRFDIVKYLLENGASFKATDKVVRNLLHYACLEGDLSFIKSLTKANLIELETRDFQNCTPLLLAAGENRFDIVKHLLENGASFEAKDKNGHNLLHYACLKGDLRFIKSLTKKNLIELDNQNYEGNTPLLLAAEGNRFDIVKYLLDNGTSFTTKNIYDQNVLHYACHQGDLSFIKSLTKENLIELDTQHFDHCTPLLVAANKNRFDIVKYLLENGASCKATDTNANNLLHHACFRGDLPFIESLTKETLTDLDNQNRESNTPLLLAAGRNRFDIVKYLLDNGTSFTAKNIHDQNLLHYACHQGDLSFIKSLSKRNLIELDTKHFDGSTPLLLAADKNRFDIAKYLLENGASFKATDSSLQNVLHYACFNGDLPFIKSLKKEILIELETPNFDGGTPLFLAATMNRFDIVKHLLDNGTSFTAKNKHGQNLLHCACWKNNLSFIKSLTKENLVELDTQNCDGDTPLLLEAGRNRFDVVKYFLENGASFRTKNKNGHNLLHFACSRGDNLAFIKSLPQENLIELDSQDCDGYTPALVAARQNYFDIVKFLLEIGFNFKVTNKSKEDIMYFAGEHEVGVEFFKSCLKPEDWIALAK